MMRRLIPLFIYIVLLIYGSLYPFSGWHWPDNNLYSLIPGWPQYISRSDLISNFLVYIPLGLFSVRILQRQVGSLAAIFTTICIGTTLSFILECLQALLPIRVSSLSDVLLNAAGTCAGAVSVVTIRTETSIGRKLLLLRHNLFLSGRTEDTGLVVLGLWTLSQLAPMVPSFDVSNLKHGLKPLWHTLHDMSRFSPYEAAIYILNIVGLGVIATFIVKDKNRVMTFFAIFTAMVLLLKIPVVGRQLSMEAVFGFAGGLILLFFWQRLKHQVLLIVAAVAILAAFIIDELRPVNAHLLDIHPFNWVPFRGQMSNLMGFASILEGIWPFTALAYLAILMRPHRMIFVATIIGLFLVILVCALEWAQQFIPGRYPDITAVMLAAIGWIGPLLFINIHAEKYHDVHSTTTQLRENLL